MQSVGNMSEDILPVNHYHGIKDCCDNDTILVLSQIFEQDFADTPVEFELGYTKDNNGLAPMQHGVGRIEIIMKDQSCDCVYARIVLDHPDYDSLVLYVDLVSCAESFSSPANFTSEHRREGCLWLL